MAVEASSPKSQKEHFIRDSTLICVVATAYYLSYFRYGLAQIDEGVIIDSAERLMKGDRYAVDLYLHYGLLRAWLLSKVFAVTGVNFTSERIFFIALRLPGLVLMYSVGRRFMPSGWSFAATLAAVFVPGHLFKSTLLIIIIGQIWLTFRWWETSSKIWTFLLGFWGPFTIWSRAESMFVITPVAFFSILVGLWLKQSPRKEWRSHALIFLIAVPIGFFCLYPIFPGILIYITWVLRFLVIVFTQEPYFYIPWPAPAYIFKGIDHAATFFCLWGAVIVYSCALLTTVLKIKESRDDDSWYHRFITATVGFSMFYNVFTQSNLAHMLQVAAPVYLLFAYFFHGSLKSVKSFSAKAAISVPFGVIAGLFFIYGLFLANLSDIGTITLRKTANTPINTGMGTVYFTDPPASSIQEVVDYLVEHTDPDDPVMGYPGCIILQVLARRPNATMMTYFLPNTEGFTGPAISAKVRKQTLDAHYMVYFERPSHLELPRRPVMRIRNSPMGIYKVMEESFTIEHRVGGYLILRRGADPTGATKVFLEGWEAYKYKEDDLAREKLGKALDMGGPKEIIQPILRHIEERTKKQ